MKSICLVVVQGGVAYASYPPHVDCRVVDLDDIKAGDDLPELPRDVGFEELVKQDGSLVEGQHFEWEKP